MFLTLDLLDQKHRTFNKQQLMQTSSLCEPDK